MNLFRKRPPSDKPARPIARGGSVDEKIELGWIGMGALEDGSAVQKRPSFRKDESVKQSAEARVRKPVEGGAHRTAVKPRLIGTTSHGAHEHEDGPEAQLAMLRREFLLDTVAESIADEFDDETEDAFEEELDSGFDEDREGEGEDAPLTADAEAGFDEETGPGAPRLVEADRDEADEVEADTAEADWDEADWDEEVRAEEDRAEPETGAAAIDPATAEQVEARPDDTARNAAGLDDAGFDEDEDGGEDGGEDEGARFDTADVEAAVPEAIAAAPQAPEHDPAPLGEADDDDAIGAAPIVQVPSPAAGRSGGARAGRVRTRLLGFEHATQHAARPLEPATEKSQAPTTWFPVGWMVLVKGPGLGASFTLFNGVQQIGRGEDQAITLDFGDTAISRSGHAVVAYDNEQNKFFLGHGGKANIVRLNDRPLLSTEELHHGDLVRIGETTLRFVALCGEGFDWDKLQSGDADDAADE